MDEYLNLKIVLLLTMGFAFASLFGYAAHRIKLSPILGYLLAGYLIGPYSPGFVADLRMAEQLAEIGVILMMFGVGLHFKWKDLLVVKNIAIPGALGQTAFSTLLTVLLLKSLGWSTPASFVTGFAVGVASTVVLVRGLADNRLLDTSEGHIAIGWLILEDILTVGILLILPLFPATSTGLAWEHPWQAILSSLGLITAKFTLLILLLFGLVRPCIRRIISHVMRTNSHELFTITILALAFAMATLSAVVFGMSIALGAFLAGMVIGQTDVRHKVSSNTSSMKDAFLVIFFLSIGMLFNPMIIYEHTQLFFALLAIIMLGKPLAAFVIVKAFRYPWKTACVIAVALAQIGEFSFILAEEADRLDLLPDMGFDLLVACSLVSISLNPLLFRKAINAK